MIGRGVKSDHEGLHLSAAMLRLLLGSPQIARHPYCGAQARPERVGRTATSKRPARATHESQTQSSKCNRSLGHVKEMAQFFPSRCARACQSDTRQRFLEEGTSGMWRRRSSSSSSSTSIGSLRGFEDDAPEEDATSSQGRETVPLSCAVL